MTKADFINKMHEHNSNETSKAQTERAFDAFFDALTETLGAGDSVTFTNFGTFKVAKRPARQGRNPRTGAVVNIPVRTVVKFTPGKGLKAALA